MRTALLACLAVVLWFLLIRRSQGAVVQGGAVQGGGAQAPPPDNDEPGGLSAVVHGVIRAESNGRQYDAQGNTLKSSAGALGIMQLMPGTAAQMGIDPNDEGQNIAGGTRYLETLFDKYGNWFDALAAYNWGPGHVDRAKAAGQQYPATVRKYANGILSSAGGD